MSFSLSSDPTNCFTRVKNTVGNSTNSFDRVKDSVESSVGISTKSSALYYTFGLLVVLIVRLLKIRRPWQPQVSVCPCLSSFRPLSLPILEAAAVWVTVLLVLLLPQVEHALSRDDKTS